MITTKITIKNHLREYLIGKYCGFDESIPVRFPDQLDIYHLIYDMLSRPYSNVKITGNLEIVLPNRPGSKPVEKYNYLSEYSQKKIERKIEVMLWVEFRDYIETEKHRNGTSYIESIFIFREKYGIESISVDAFKKNYYRWKNRLLKREKRSYIHKKV